MAPVAVPVVVSVFEESVATVVVGGNGVSEGVVRLFIDRNPPVECVGTAVLDTDPDPLIVERRKGVKVYDATDRIPTVKRTLRTAQHLHLPDVIKSEIVVVFVEVGDVVHIESDGRLVDAGTDSPDVDRGGHLRSVVGNVEVGRDERQVADGFDPFAADAAHADRCRGDGLRGVLFRGGVDDDFGNFVGREGICPVRGSLD